MNERYTADLTVEEIIVERRRAHDNPSIRWVDSAIIKDLPRSRTIALLYEIVDPNTDQQHHYSLKIETLTSTKESGWQFQSERSISLESKESNEIAKLVTFLVSVMGSDIPQESGTYTVCPFRVTILIKKLIRRKAVLQFLKERRLNDIFRDQMRKWQFLYGLWIESQYGHFFTTPFFCCSHFVTAKRHAPDRRNCNAAIFPSVTP